MRTTEAAAAALADAAQTAKAVGLNYVLDSRPGISRERRRGRFVYRMHDGTPVRDKATLARISRIVIPPAWTQVWICPHPQGHLQATGRDARGRKQYRYHAEWRRVRDENKYERLGAFVRALPAIRKRVAADLRLPGLPRNKVVAAVVRLLETTFIRIGNERYARDNGSFGLTTLRNKHVRVRGSRIEFQFRGKSGKEHAVKLSDAKLAAILKRCRDLPGYQLFEYIEDGEVRSVDSADVNAYLREVTGEDYTAKDFRTWGGTLLAGLALAKQNHDVSATEAARVVTQAIREVAAELGNTAAICRKCYIHPRIFSSFEEGALAALRGAACRTLRGLRREEALVLAVLDRAGKAGARQQFARPRSRVPAGNRMPGKAAVVAVTAA